MSKWLENLTPGDTVIVSGSGSAATNYTTTVERLTKTLVILNPHGTRYNRNTGSEVGGDRWHSKHIIEPTVERVAAIRAKHHRTKVVQTFRNINTNDLSIKQLEQIIEIANK